MNAKSKKPQKLKPRLPRGLSDRDPAEIAATRRMIETIRAVYERYGFEPVETPAFEYTDALGKFLPDQDRPNEGVFSFQDDDEQWLSLRYDLTAPLARYVAENFETLPKPYRSYRQGWVFRNEKPGPGRFRQFMQFDADTVGSASPAADAEMCMMAADTMEALGIPRGSYVVKVNNRKVLDGVLESIGLGGDENAGRRLIVLRAIDKYDRLGEDGVRLLLGPGRKDESGDFTKGAELHSEAIEHLLAMFDINAASTAAFNEHMSDFPIEVRESVSVTARENALVDAVLAGTYQVIAKSPRGLEGLAELRELWRLFSNSTYNDGRIRIDPAVVRGLEYYTGPVFEVELTFPIEDEKGNPVRFGSVGGGGRYDGLVSRFRGEPVPATGFSIGVSRLLAALQRLEKIDTKPAAGPVVVTVFDRDPVRLADYQRMVQQLRDADIRAELYLGNPKNIPNQLKYADRRNSPCVIIQGGDEKNNPAGPHVLVKDLILGAELAREESDHDAYLQRQAEAQQLVPEDQLIDAVRAVLTRPPSTAFGGPPPPLRIRSQGRMRWRILTPANGLKWRKFVLLSSPVKRGRGTVRRTVEGAPAWFGQQVARMRAPTKTIEKARQLRRNLSLPEARLWRCLKSRGPTQPVFRRQHPIGPFVIDFYCAKARLAVEIDGIGHDMANRPAYDARRDAWLAAHGITVIRIPAADLMQRFDETADAIFRMAEELSK